MLVNPRPAVVVETADREVAVENLESRNEVAGFGGGEHADVRGRFADGEGPHAVRTAEREFFRRREVLHPLLAGYRQEDAQGIGDALEASRVDVVFAEAPLGVAARGADVQRED